MRYASLAAVIALGDVLLLEALTAAGVPLLFVLLDTDPAELARRLGARAGHYMPASLLDSQLATLERPTADENALMLDAGRTPDALGSDVLTWLGITIPGSAQPPG